MSELIERLERRAYEEAGAGNGSVRWWLNAIADELETKNEGPAHHRISGGPTVARWLRSQASPTASEAVTDPIRGESPESK